MTWPTSSGRRSRPIEALPPAGSCCSRAWRRRARRDVYLAALDAPCSAARDGDRCSCRRCRWSRSWRTGCVALVGDELAVLHSGLSAGERHDEWWRILRGEARVVVGTRTAVFAPLASLGLIVVDEAHDGGYKSDRTPRYDARWVARRRAALSGARLVFGTATPDVVTLARVRGGLRRAQPCCASGASAARRRSSWSTCATSWPAGQPLDLLAAAAPMRSRDLRRRDRAGDPAHQPPRRRDLHPVPRLRREPALPGLRPAVRLPPRPAERLRCHHCGRTARPPERCPHCGSPPDPLLRRRDPAGRGGAPRALPASAGRAARLGRAGRAARLRGGLRRLPRRPRSTCWSAPSSPRRASTCRPSRWPRSSPPT